MGEEKKVSRRDYLKYTGAAIGGLVVGGALGYLLKPAEVIEKTATVTIPGVEKTVTTTVTVPPTKPKPKYKFYVVVHGGIVHPFWKVVEKGVRDADAILDEVEVVYTGPEIYKLEEFLSLLEAAVAAKPDALLVTMTAPDAMKPTLLEAAKKGIIITEINTAWPKYPGRDPNKEVPVLTYVGEDHYKMGALVAKSALRIAKEKGVTIKRVVYGNHHPGAWHIEERARGCLETFKEAGIPGEQIDVTADPVKGAELLLAYIKAHPDTNFVQPAGTEHSEAFVKRLEEEGLIGKIYVGTIDLSPKVLEYIKEGKMWFATDQQQYLQGYLGVMLTYLHVAYKFMPPSVFPTGEACVDATNVTAVEELVNQGIR
jgi:simple sugar transport system substrate-binding protein